jgi:predicted DNA binding CopG/RHH family protein
MLTIVNINANASFIMKKGASRMKLISARIPEPLARQLKAEANKRGMKLQALIANALAEYLRKGKSYE